MVDERTAEAEYQVRVSETIRIPTCPSEGVGRHLPEITSDWIVHRLVSSPVRPAFDHSEPCHGEYPSRCRSRFSIFFASLRYRTRSRSSKSASISRYDLM